MTNGLVALAATAVIAVYSAGFLRTKAAADELEAPGIRRPPQTPPPLHEVIPALDVEPPPETRPEALAAAAPASAEPARSTTSAAGERSGPSATAPAGDPAKAGGPAPKVTETTPRSTAKARSASTANPVEAATPVPTSTADPGGAPAGAPATTGEATPSPAPPPAAPVATSPPSPQAAAPPVPAPAPPPQPALPEPDNYPAPAVLYKDGTYTGWGTSRHGDIQATVVIEGGRIASAKISECWTRYPCSWIAKLPPQVAERQSPEVDFVSGATQSTNAFYYAVIQALAKAK
ncbi:MAG: FMN-binding protein [Vicinamibacterales bacterium]